MRGPLAASSFPAHVDALDNRCQNGFRHVDLLGDFRVTFAVPEHLPDALAVDAQTLLYEFIARPENRSHMEIECGRNRWRGKTLIEQFSDLKIILFRPMDIAFGQCQSKPGFSETVMLAELLGGTVADDFSKPVICGDVCGDIDDIPAIDIAQTPCQLRADYRLKSFVGGQPVEILFLINVCSFGSIHEIAPFAWSRQI
ncbi:MULTISPECIES: hypothetical protein [unclassified Agrobacterium]|uniref:hypothetical protein n=1 Tax=unclassified Agrobacterium TaxID=2632611 RepID=UPI00244A3D6C|nr:MULTISPECIES: hypothetical protein [unclassified Agrobacterium]MDH0615162.1 hypothetical protein [Agrobacterium sp. GD03872]MDH0698209.1 hypothetical protein [Agrobacterium sp. GD03871]MDH1060235.1 hypothetical protein [Agrobacterium sp. GD03992]MDH2211991.1 hypothetical protein [Agrobacterium sp. GD03643]MDH2220296.1 hypothetical protein [Agrobacterium sp. GD03638]